MQPLLNDSFCRELLFSALHIILCAQCAHQQKTARCALYIWHMLICQNCLFLKVYFLFLLGNKLRAEEQKRKEKAAKEEQKRAYGAILQLKQRQRAEVLLFNINVNLCYVT